VNRRTVAAVCLFVSPVLHAVSYLLWPAESEGSDAAQLAAAATHPGAWAAAAVTEAVGWMLLLPALAVLWFEIRGRGARLVTIGVWGSVLGVFGFYAGTVLNLVTIDIGRLDDGARVYDALRGDGLLAVAAVLPLMLGLLSLVVLLAGIARAGWAGWWLPALGAVAVVASEVLPGVQTPLLLIAAFAPMAAAWVVVGLRLTARPVVPASADPMAAAAGR
jgi:hypothetical protein